jgi:hypothetical protein
MEYSSKKQKVNFVGTPDPNLSCHVFVKKVISGSLDRETDPIRALIGGVCRVWQWTPSHAVPQ